MARQLRLVAPPEMHEPKPRRARGHPEQVAQGRVWVRLFSQLSTHGTDKSSSNSHFASFSMRVLWEMVSNPY